MIFNTTYKNKDDEVQLNEMLGKPYSFIERIKLKGIGSSKLIIKEFSTYLKPKDKQVSDINYVNIELRPKGVILHFTNKQQRFAWAIPYYKLHIYKTNFFSIHANGHFIKIQKDKQYRANHSFLNKMNELKIKYLQLGYYDG